MERVAHICYSFSVEHYYFIRSSGCVFPFWYIYFLFVERKLPDSIKAINERKKDCLCCYHCGGRRRFYSFFVTVKLFTKLHRMRAYNRKIKKHIIYPQTCYNRICYEWIRIGIVVAVWLAFYSGLCVRVSKSVHRVTPNVSDGNKRNVERQRQRESTRARQLRKRNSRRAVII